MSRFPHLPAETWDGYLADRLQDAAERRVDAHLAGCADCRTVLAAVDPTRSFRGLRDAGVRPEVLAGLWEDVAAEMAGPVPRAASRRSRGRLWLASAAAAIAVVATGLAVDRVLRDDGANRAAATEDACPESVAASLRLTREECLALGLGRPIDSPEPPVVVLAPGLDLRGL